MSSSLTDPRLGRVEVVDAEGSLVIGSGAAGLAAALAGRRSTLVTEAAVGTTGSSRWAQGGLAAAVDSTDSAAAHAADTIAVAGGLAVDGVVTSIIDEGPALVAELMELGVRFDTGPDGELSLGREAGHSASRIAHARGDATGAEIVGALRTAVLNDPGVEILSNALVVDLLGAPSTSGRLRVAGALVLAGRRLMAVRAEQVILATGGYGYVFARCTTPPQAIGSGLASAVRLGAQIADLEFVQFHPTALDVSRTPRPPVAGSTQLPLLTEALRGAGASLVDETGHRFLVDLHPSAELAPRDVVARAIYHHQRDGHGTWLDARMIGPSVAERFPTVFELLHEHGLDPRADLLPVSPAAHYCMGGVAADPDGRTTVEGLWAVGEVASTGLHGANRLASNSLLEALVMGARAGRAAAGPVGASPGADGELWLPTDLHAGLIDASAITEEQELRELMWSALGVERTGADMQRAAHRIDSLGPDRNLRTRTIRLIAAASLRAALERAESRGAHFRSDHPDPDARMASRRIRSPEPVGHRVLGAHCTEQEVAA